MKIAVILGVMLCSLVEIYLCVFAPWKLRQQVPLKHL